MRHVLIGVTLLLCSLPGEAARRRPVSSGNSACLQSLPGLQRCMLAFVSERDGNSEIYVVNVNGTGLVRLTYDAGSDLDPAWSPDGNRIAFASDRAGNSDIYVMDADGSNLVQLTEGGASHPTWSPDGRKIAFSSFRGGQTGIYVLSLAPSASRLNT